MIEKAPTGAFLFYNFDESEIFYPKIGVDLDNKNSVSYGRQKRTTIGY